MVKKARIKQFSCKSAFIKLYVSHTTPIYANLYVTPVIKITSRCTTFKVTVTFDGKNCSGARFSRVICGFKNYKHAVDNNINSWYSPPHSASVLRGYERLKKIKIVIDKYSNRKFKVLPRAVTGLLLAWELNKKRSLYD